MDNEPAMARYSFATRRTPSVAQVGGKGSSLIELTRAGLPVPSGFVLTADFFLPWLEKIRAMSEWDTFVHAVRAEEPAEELSSHAAPLRDACADLAFTEVQKRVLSDALADLASASAPDSAPDAGLFAVRSSAPQEDLTGASFAGVYDTVLNVRQENLARAVRIVFASNLDSKAIAYKLRRGFDPTTVEIAVVVQQQLDSASAGVAFSLNPRTNDYDEVVIQANWGLGETVVSGNATPDQFVIDKVTGRVLDIKLGAKETVLWSEHERGAVHKPEQHSGDNGRCALTEQQAARVARLAGRVEAHTAVPVDIEWAFDHAGELHLLQSRPITTYFPLPEQLRTSPNEHRRLYADATLLEEGLQQPLSVLGARWMADALVEITREITGLRISTRDPDGLALTVGGRWYANLSNILWLGKKRLARSLETFDVHAARILRDVDARRYRKAATTPPAASTARAVAGTLVYSVGLVGRTVLAVTKPEHARQRFQRAVTRHQRQLAEAARTARSLPELGHKTLASAIPLLMREGLPLTVAAEAATALLRLLYRNCPPEQRKRLDEALRSMPHNVTIDMGLALYQLARSLETSLGRQSYDDFPTLVRRVQERELPEAFLREWDAFMNSYGFRGPNELDLAAERYADNPELTLEQMRHYTLLDESTHQSPQHAYERRQRERRDAIRTLLAATRNPLKARLARRLYRAAEEFSGYREIHKYHLMHASAQVRQRALETGRALVERERLDSVQQVFDLTYEDLHTVSDEPRPDLRTKAHNNTHYRRTIQHLPGAHFPVVVDSRGRISRSTHTNTGPGVLAGEGISPGTARGPAKVLSHVGEKPVLPGEILVARATDPGWTPLFVNAAGIVLETGGSFQHGALVAREYGKPCLAGIEGATQRISDGQLIEIDGTAGTATIVALSSDRDT